MGKEKPPKNADFLLKIEGGKLVVYCREKNKCAVVEVPSYGIPFLRSEMTSLYDVLYTPLCRGGVCPKENVELQSLNPVTLNTIEGIARIAVENVQERVVRSRKSFTDTMRENIKKAKILVDSLFNQVVITSPLPEHGRVPHLVPPLVEKLEKSNVKCYADWQKSRLGLEGHFTLVKITGLWCGVEIYSGHDSLYDRQLTGLLVDELEHEIKGRGLLCQVVRRWSSPFQKPS